MGVACARRHPRASCVRLRRAGVPRRHAAPDV